VPVISTQIEAYLFKMLIASIARHWSLSSSEFEAWEMDWIHRRAWNSSTERRACFKRWAQVYRL